jgi:hypothetical protein
MVPFPHVLGIQGISLKDELVNDFVATIPVEWHFLTY